jgi:glycosyltransferase involved in cell wall biosynthesis
MTQRILFSESSRNVGGQELQLVQQMRLLNARGIETKLICRPSSAIHQVALRNLLDTETASFRNSLHLPTLHKVRNVIDEWKPDALVCHSGIDANICGLATRFVRGRPRVIRVKTYNARTPRVWSHNWLSDCTLVPSEEMRSLVLSNPRIRAERIHVLYPGVAFSEIEAAAEQRLPDTLEAWLASHPGPVLAHVAMLRPEKGHQVMLEAIASLREQYPTLRYVVAGEGGERSAIARRIVELGIEGQVFLAGMLSAGAPLMRRATAVVMPSLVEPLGMAQIEALGLGVPVIASNVGGIPETITDRKTGLLVAPHDVGAWRQAITWALEHAAAMQGMAQSGRTDMRARFSAEANIERFLQLIDVN